MGRVGMYNGVPVWKGEWYREPEKDCRFYDEVKRDCSALRCLYCAYEHKKCNFYKEKKDDN